MTRWRRGTEQQRKGERHCGEFTISGRFIRFLFSSRPGRDEGKICEIKKGRNSKWPPANELWGHDEIHPPKNTEKKKKKRKKLICFLVFVEEEEPLCFSGGRERKKVGGRGGGKKEGEEILFHTGHRWKITSIPIFGD